MVTESRIILRQEPNFPEDRPFLAVFLGEFLRNSKLGTRSMAVADGQKKGFEDRLSRIRKGGANTMGEVQIGPRDEIDARKSRPTNTVRLKRKKPRNVNIGEGSNVILAPIAAVVGALSMFVGQASQYHLFQPGGLFNIQMPVEAIAPALPYAHFIIAVFLALSLSWAFGLTNLVRRMAMIAGLAAVAVWQTELVERYPGVYTGVFSEAFVAEKLG